MTSPRVTQSTGTLQHLDTLANLIASEAPSESGTKAGLIASIVAGNPTPGQREIWLILAVLTGSLPTFDEVVATYRSVQFDGLAATITALARGNNAHTVKVVESGVVVDAHHTVTSSLSTGIQRVVRNVLDRWSSERAFTLVGWDPDFHALREVPAGSHRAAVAGPGRGGAAIVPWNSTYLLPELSVERPRLARIEALAEFSGNVSGVIGYDCVPMTSAETAGPGMPAAFSENLAAVARTTKVATISEAAGSEYRGWRSMLGSAGITGPEVMPIGLPLEAVPIGDATVDPRATLALDELPIVLCVGSHEPRKNHLAVLHAAELLWRDGLEFQLVFCGGNAWNSERFEERLAALRAAGRPVSSHARVSDATLNALYRVARFSIFPSLNEGYGLPVAESIAAGTPVITSSYGSMQDIAATGGALLVDPRDDDSIAAAMRRLLDGDDPLERLRAEAAGRATSSWAAYADELWSFFVG